MALDFRLIRELREIDYSLTWFAEHFSTSKLIQTLDDRALGDSLDIIDSRLEGAEEHAAEMVAAFRKLRTILKEN